MDKKECKEYLQDLMFKVGKYITDTEDFALGYDSVGVNEDKDVFSIGFQNNPKASLMVSICENTLDDVEEYPYLLKLSYNHNLDPCEALRAWFMIFEQLPAKIILINSFK